MASVQVDGFESSVYFSQIHEFLTNTPSSQKVPLLKKSAGVYQFDVKKGAKTQVWTIDLNGAGSVITKAPSKKPDIQITLDDAVFVSLVQGKITGQKAFMQGKLKAKGNLSFSGKLDNFLKEARNNGLSGGSSNAGQAPSGTSDVKSIEVAGFKSSQVFKQVKAWMDSMPSEQRKKEVFKIKGLFQIDVKAGGKVQTWTIDLKNQTGDAYIGAPKSKADAIISIADEDFLSMASGKLNGQKAFMTGKLKVKGQMMLATKLDALFKNLPKSKL
ncbi:hypothetical protein DSO57_1014028 [Entomophthora muscae]|uniref:Uncharacterized protein n=1 Tax=Entomophthora muscae TaxID=34485 RepID=A0ACC2T5M4_9FUNG|nr:hypothetical protein DSO57_1014028 [Entomophthora muscae]